MRVIVSLSFIDRVNIGNARVAGLQTDLKMSDYQYSLALTITYIPYIAVEIPAGLILKRVGANILLPAMVTLWGLIATLQGLVTSYQGLLIARFFLGLVEGGLIPGVVLVMSRFYKRDQIHLRMALFFTVASSNGGLSGILASIILRMDGRAGYSGWQWIFILVRIRLCGPCITTYVRILINLYRRRGFSLWHLDSSPSSFFQGPQHHPGFSLRKRNKLFTQSWSKIGRLIRRKRYFRGGKLSLRSRPLT